MGKSFDEQERIQVLRAAQLVAKRRFTEYREKQYGGCYVFIDEKMVIVLDTFLTTTYVLLRDHGNDVIHRYRGTCVLACQAGECFSAFRPGRWIEYLLALEKRITADHEKRRTYQTVECISRFTPIDDSALFTEGDAGT